MGSAQSGRDGGLAGGLEVLARAVGRSGELVLRRRGEDLQVIAGGSFLMSSANAASSAALVTAGLDALAATGEGQGVAALVGGLGLGYSLDVALADPRIDRVTVVEIEPVIVDWFRIFGEGRAARLAAAEAAGRARLVVDDVLAHLRASGGAYDLVTLDTDNGPDWLVRAENAALYAETGLAAARAALRPGGVAVYWSPERYDAFAARLAGVFGRVGTRTAQDTIGERSFEYTMYVASREGEGT
ncbi:spermidine synthase [bacterium]|nr:spermidine synthase [bacterium]